MLVSAGGYTRVRTFPGKVEASKKVELAFQVSGLIVGLPAREGKEVKKGELIAKLREDDFKARLKERQGELERARATLQALQAGERPEEQMRREAEVRAAAARLSNASSENQRNRQLLNGRAISVEEYERGRTALRVAQEEYTAARQRLEMGTVAREEDILAKEAAVRGLEGRVVEAKIQLDDCTLRAPYDGVIAKRFVELQQNVKAKEPIVKFQDADEIEIAVDVPETVMVVDIRRADIVQMLAEFSAGPGLMVG